MEMDHIMRRSQIKQNTANKGFVRIRGLPFNCKREDVIEFFKGFFLNFIETNFLIDGLLKII